MYIIGLNPLLNYRLKRIGIEGNFIDKSFRRNMDSPYLKTIRMLNQYKQFSDTEREQIKDMAQIAAEYLTDLTTCIDHTGNIVTDTVLFSKKEDDELTSSKKLRFVKILKDLLLYQLCLNKTISTRSEPGVAVFSDHYNPRMIKIARDKTKLCVSFPAETQVFITPSKIRSSIGSQAPIKVIYNKEVVNR